MTPCSSTSAQQQNIKRDRRFLFIKDLNRDTAGALLRACLLSSAAAAGAAAASLAAAAAAAELGEAAEEAAGEAGPKLSLVSFLSLNFATPSNLLFVSFFILLSPSSDP